MEDEYTISTGTKIFYGVMGAVAAVAAMVFGKMIQQPGKPEGLLLIPLALLVVSALIFVNIVRRKVVIYNDSILVVNLFTKKELYFKDIKGCRIEPKIIFIEPVSPEYPTIRIGNYSDFGGSSAMTALLKEKFPDLDSQDLENTRKQYMQDANFGITEADREAALKKAKGIAIAYSVWGWVLFGLTLAFDNAVFIVMTMLYPFIGLILMWYTKGIIKFITSVKKSVYPHILLGYMPAAMLMGVRAISIYDALDAHNIWLPAIGLTIILFTATYFADRIKFVEQSAKGKAVLMLIIAAIYGFGTVWNSNCYFDKSQPRIYQTTVLDHRISHGRSTSYYITIAPWGPIQQETEVDAGRWLYNNALIGDTVKVKLRPGLLHMPWYIVTRH